MCSIHMDQSAMHVSTAARSSHLYVPFSKKLDSLVYCLDNQSMMHSFQCSVHEGHTGIETMSITVAPRCSTRYKYSFHLVLVEISHSLTFA
jgi:hypothetical protein